MQAEVLLSPLSALAEPGFSESRGRLQVVAVQLIGVVAHVAANLIVSQFQRLKPFDEEIPANHSQGAVLHGF